MRKIYVLLIPILLFLLFTSCTSMSSSSKQEREGKLENNKKKIATLEFNEIDANIKNAIVMNGIFQVQLDDGMIALMNMDGKLINGSKYKMYMGFSEGYAFVEDENNYKYYIDVNGKKIIEEVDGKNMYLGDIFSNGVAKISVILNGDKKEKSEYMYIDKQGNVLNYEKPMYNNYEIFYVNEFGSFYTDNTYVGIFDNVNNTPITKLDYTEISGPFVEGRAIAVNKDNETLLIDSTGSIIENISKRYKEKSISSYNISRDGIVINFENNNSIILSLEAKEEITTNYTGIGMFIDGFAKCNMNGKYGLIDTKGNEVIPFEYVEMSNPYQHKVLLKKENKWYICKFF